MKSAIRVTCMRCQHVATLPEQTLAAFGLKPDASIAGFIKRLRCGKCGSRSVMATRPLSSNGAVSAQKRRA